MERDEIARYVPDASVAVKWFVGEHDSEIARRLKELFKQGLVDLDAPSLLKYEVGSALRFHPAVKLSPALFRVAMESLEELQVTRDPTQREWSIAYKLSLENSMSIYDAIYLSFAVGSNSILVTADAELTQRIKEPETKRSVLLLDEVDLDTESSRS